MPVYDMSGCLREHGFVLLLVVVFAHLQPGFSLSSSCLSECVEGDIDVVNWNGSVAEIWTSTVPGEYITADNNPKSPLLFVLLFRPSPGQWCYGESR